MIYKNLEHFPLGNTNLNVINNDLIISNINQVGEGVIINNANINDWEVEFNPINIENGKSITLSLFGKDSFNRIKVIGESSVANIDGNGSFCVNSKLMGPTIYCIAKNGNQIVHQFNFPNPAFMGPINNEQNYIQVIIATVLILLQFIDYKRVITKDSTGKVISDVTTYSFGSSTSIPYKDPNGNLFIADHIYISSELNYGTGLNPNYFCENSSLQIGSGGISQLIIKNETY